jgi:hypothetical protein
MTPEPRQLPPEIQQAIEEGIRDGIFYKLTPIKEGERHRVLEINWRPGDPNPLAQAIIEKVGDEDMPLNLDGHRYWIRKAL